MLYLHHRKRQRTHLRNYKLWELVKVTMLLLNLIKSWCDRITDRWRSNNNTNIRENNTLFQNESKIF